MAVQQEHRWAVAAVSDGNRCVTELDLIRLESGEHDFSMPHQPGRPGRGDRRRRVGPHRAAPVGRLRPHAVRARASAWVEGPDILVDVVSEPPLTLRRIGSDEPGRMVKPGS